MVEWAARWGGGRGVMPPLPTLHPHPEATEHGISGKPANGGSAQLPEWGSLPAARRRR